MICVNFDANETKFVILKDAGFTRIYIFTLTNICIAISLRDFFRMKE